jgi:phospholipase D-like protein
MGSAIDAMKGGPGASVGWVPSWLWIVIVVLDILVIIFVVQSRKRFLVKVVWILVILLLPLLGLILYFLLGREKG